MADFKEKFQAPEYVRNDDQLFRCDLDDWQHNACLNYMVEKIAPIADGYKTAADILVSHCLSSNSGRDLDSIVYPIVYNYRHYIELRLKELIKGLRICLSRKGFPHTHNISELWFEFQTLYEQTGNELSENFVNTEKVILELAATDASSMTFRYPEDKQGNVSYKQNINIRNLSEVMNRISTLIDGISDLVSVMVDNRQEF